MKYFKDFYHLDFSSRTYICFMGVYWVFKYIETLWRRIGIEDPVLPNIFILLLLMLFSISKWKNKIHFVDIILYILCVLFYFLSPTIYPITRNIIEEKALNTLLYVIPFFFIGLIFQLKDNRRWVVIFSYLAILINIVYMLLNVAGNGDSEEFMRRAYIMLPSLIVILWNAVEYKKKIDISFALVGFFLICGYGSRGPFVCIFVFLFIYLFFFYQYKKPVLTKSIIVLVSLFLYSIIDFFANFMISIVSGIGLSTRIFDKMLSNALVNYEESNGRDYIQSFLFQKLNENNGEGFGLFSDRVLIGRYAHNFFVEMLVDFGYVLGSLMSIFFVFFILYSAYNCKNRNDKIFIIVMFCSYFMEMMFSGSYLQNMVFYFLLGFCVQSHRNRVICL